MASLIDSDPEVIRRRTQAIRDAGAFELLEITDSPYGPDTLLRVGWRHNGDTTVWDDAKQTHVPSVQFHVNVASRQVTLLGGKQPEHYPEPITDLLTRVNDQRFSAYTLGVRGLWLLMAQQNDRLVALHDALQKVLATRSSDEPRDE